MSEELWDRPVAWSATGDGEFPYTAQDDGIQYVLRVNDFPAEPLYTLMSDGTEIIDLDEWPNLWGRPAMPANLRTIAARELDKKARYDGRLLVDLDRIAAWVDGLCTTTETAPMKVFAALDIPGQIEDHTTGAATLEPPPLGATRLAIGKHRGAFADLGLTLAASTITRSDLDSRFGPGEPLPRVHADRPWQLAYRIERPRAPYAVTLFASFASPPEHTTIATSVSLRRENTP